MKNEKGYTFRNSKTNIVAPIEKVPPKKRIINVGSGFGVLFLIFFVVIVLKIVFVGSTDLTFTSFLDFISNLQPAQIDLSIFNLHIVTDWGLFNGLREFINSILGIFNFALSVTQMLVNALIYVFEIVRWLLV